MRSRILGLLALATASTLLLAAGPSLAPPVIYNPDIRRADNPNRDALTAMEFKPIAQVAPGLFDNLSDWTNGSALTLDSIKGKPVLIVNWSSWQPTSQRLVSRLAGFKDKYPDLVILAAHAAPKWDTATAWVKDNAPGILVAHDASGKFRAALKADNDPGVYIIDRAGQLRFAGIETPSIEKALEIVVPETPDAAAGALAKLQAPKTVEELHTRPADAVPKPGERARPVFFTPPNASVYEKSIWPRKNENVNGMAKDLQGERFPFTPGPDAWLTDKPNLLGKIVILHIWHTAGSWTMRDVQDFQSLLALYPKDLAVVGISGYRTTTGGTYTTDENTDTRANVQRFLREHRIEYPQLYDVDDKVLKAADVHVSMIFLISTDGVVRWEGFPEDPTFRPALETVMKYDPGLKARQEAERKAAE